MRHRWTALVATTAALVSVLFGPTAPAHADPGEVAQKLTKTEVSFTGDGGVVLHGTVVAPEHATAARRSGIVLLEGAGNRGRGYLMPEAEAYARHGIVALVYDKRTVGYSMVHRDYSVLADDALAGLELLRSRPDVDPGRVGLWALSEGAFVAPIAANRSADVSFLVTVGAVGTTPADQTAWEYEQYLRHDGVSGALSRALRTVALPTIVAAGLFPESSFDPAPEWQQVRQPVLAEWGQLDRDAVPVDSSRIIRDALDRAGNRAYTMRVVPNVNHDLHVTAADGFDRLPDLPAGYGDYEATWIADPRHMSVGSDLPAGALAFASPGSYRTPWWQLAVALLSLLCFVGSGVVAVIRRGRVAGRPVRAASWLAVLGPTTIAVTTLYLVFLLVDAAKVTGPVVVGRPVPWLLLKVLALATVAATAVVTRSWWRNRRDLRLAVLTAGGILFVPFAVSWGLLLP